MSTQIFIYTIITERGEKTIPAQKHHSAFPSRDAFYAFLQAAANLGQLIAVYEGHGKSGTRLK